MFSALLATSFNAGCSVLLRPQEPHRLQTRALKPGRSRDAFYLNFGRHRDAAELYITQYEDALRTLHQRHQQNLAHLGEISNINEKHKNIAKAHLEEARKRMVLLRSRLDAFTDNPSHYNDADEASIEVDMRDCMRRISDTNRAIVHYKPAKDLLKEADSVGLLIKASIIMCHVFFTKLRRAQERSGELNAADCMAKQLLERCLKKA